MIYNVLISNMDFRNYLNFYLVKFVEMNNFYGFNKLKNNLIVRI